MLVFKFLKSFKKHLQETSQNNRDEGDLRPMTRKIYDRLKTKGGRPEWGGKDGISRMRPNKLARLAGEGRFLGEERPEGHIVKDGKWLSSPEAGINRPS